jgi:hypothetical protein
MKNVKIALDDRTAARARRLASKHGMSLSRYLRELLKNKMRDSQEYERAMRRFFAARPQLQSDPNQRYPRREELYDRGRLR